MQAAARAPSIVFLDELDGLVPARGASANPGAQIYASVVSTLLALLDGISDRGDVVVIGATNRCADCLIAAEPQAFTTNRCHHPDGCSHLAGIFNVNTYPLLWFLGHREGLGLVKGFHRAQQCLHMSLRVLLFIGLVVIARDLAVSRAFTKPETACT